MAKRSQPKVITDDLSLYYGARQALKNVSLEIEKCQITSIIGPSGCGKTSFLRVLNRMHDLVDHARISGHVAIDGQDIYEQDLDVVQLRRSVGMIFQTSHPFPKSIYENVAYGPRLNGVREKAELDETVIKSLRRAAIWNEVKDILKNPALQLSGGQQQRLCIARALAVNPGLLLMDEPCSALDPISTAKIEELMLDLKKKVTIIIVTHNLQQAARVSDYTAFLYEGKLIEYGRTSKLFTNPTEKYTEEYVTGRFG